MSPGSETNMALGMPQPELPADVSHGTIHVAPPPAATEPRLIETAPKRIETTILLYCPEQGGWQTGEWWTVDGPPRFVATICNDYTLEATHWLPAPDPPEGEGE